MKIKPDYYWYRNWKDVQYTGRLGEREYSKLKTGTFIDKENYFNVEI